MKKIFYVATMALVLSTMVACGNKKADKAETTDSVKVEVVDTLKADSIMVVDSVAIDSVKVKE
jgi:hypothetical protein